MKKITRLFTSLPLIAVLAFSGCGSSSQGSSSAVLTPAADLSAAASAEAADTGSDSSEASSASSTDAAQEETSVSSFTSLERHYLIDGFTSYIDSSLTPSVEPYSVNSDLSNVSDISRFYLSDDVKQLLSENLFAVVKGYDKEFFETYETNRYSQYSSFVTVDSMMHTYHLYFSYLCKSTEQNFISDRLYQLSCNMMNASIEQYNALPDGEWADAAKNNVIFFAVAARLQNPQTAVPEMIEADVTAEVEKATAASGIEKNSITGSDIDYSQFLPRGYYEGNETLEKYFRAMMWYGQLNFAASDDACTRSAVLCTLALSGDTFDLWENIYSVTAFFAGASDDLTYYDYLPAIEAVYGESPEVTSLDDEQKWSVLQELISQMDAPAINSIPTPADSDDDVLDENKGFRFMGQRFTIDEGIFQQLVYNNVGEDSTGDTRTLPDTLDVPAALGSDTAYEILDEQGDTDYEGYTENMDLLREGVSELSENTWSSSLYSSWLYTLTPLISEKEDGYPSFMLSDAWQKKDLESFCGSYAELKHDTILYSKQVMTEMGGDDGTVYDDRGYVEPEVEVWNRFINLSEKTSEGLDSYGILSDNDRDNLGRLTELAKSLLTISEKELQNETLTDDEYDLIRNYGGNLEHFFTEAMSAQTGSSEPTSDDYPSPVVADIATSTSDGILEVATGKPSKIYVIAPVDGQLKLCVGVVYSFYQFTSDDRLTDSAWRQMIGAEVTSSGSYNYQNNVEQPQWTQSYRSDQ